MATTRSVITLLTGQSGAGKSFWSTREAVEFFLPQREGLLVTNVPLDVDAIAAYLKEKHDIPESEVKRRIILMPPAMCQAWEQGRGGPWDDFAEIDLNGALIIFDEFHKFCSTFHSKPCKSQWVQWLGHVRHRGGGVQCILMSQNSNKIAYEVTADCGTWLNIENSENIREPWTGILLGDWYEVKAKFVTGEYTTYCKEVEKRRDGPKDWDVSDVRWFRMLPIYFKLYDSHDALERGAVKGEAPKREFETRTRLGLLLWFFRRSAFRLSWRFALVFMFFFLLNGNVFGYLFNKISDGVAGTLVPNLGAAEAAGEAKAASAKPSQGPMLAPEDSAKWRDQVAMFMRQNAQITLELQAEREQSNNLRLMLEEQKTKIERSFIVALLTADSVTFRGGYTYRLNETIDWGPYAGQAIKAIDWPRRAVLLSDGTILRGGADTAGVSIPAGPPGTPRTIVSGPLRGPTEARVSDAGWQPVGTPPHNVGVGNAAARLPSVLVQPNPSERGSGPTPGQSSGNGGRFE